MLYLLYIYSTSDNFIAGKYNNTVVDSDTAEYLIILYLNYDYIFLYGLYNDLENNYAKVTCSFVNLEKTNYIVDYQYSLVTMTVNKETFIVNDEPNETDFNSNMEFCIINKNLKKRGRYNFYKHL